MSSDEDAVGSPIKPTTSSTGQRAGEKERELEQDKVVRNASNFLRQQHSFEERYSSIIQKQIWESTINKDVMDRQLNAYFPFARSASLSKNEAECFNSLLNPTPESSEGIMKPRSLSTTPTKHRSAASLKKCVTSEKSKK